MGNEQADAGRDCRIRLRDQILRRARRRGNINFPCSADHEQDWQPYPVDPYSCYMWQPYIHTIYDIIGTPQNVIIISRRVKRFLVFRTIDPFYCCMMRWHYCRILLLSYPTMYYIVFGWFWLWYVLQCFCRNPFKCHGRCFVFAAFDPT